MRYFYNPRSDEVLGPHALSVLEAMVEAGEIAGQCPVCREGGNEWAPLNDVLGSGAEKLLKNSKENGERWGTAVGTMIGGMHHVHAQTSIFSHPSIPQHKLGGAMIQYAGSMIEMGDSPMVLVDNTIMGTAMDGLIIGMKNLYWKNKMQKPLFLPLKQVTTVTSGPPGNSPQLIINGGIIIDLITVTDDAVRELADLIAFMARPDMIQLIDTPTQA